MSTATDSVKAPRTEKPHVPSRSVRHLALLPRLLGAGSVLAIVAAAAVALWMGDRSTHSFLPGSGAAFDRVTAAGDLFTYRDSVFLSFAQVEGKGVLQARIVDATNYTGFGIARPLHTDEAATLRLRWRSRGRADYVAVEVQATPPDLPARATWVRILDPPGPTWSEVDLPLSLLEWNQNVNPADWQPRPLPVDHVWGASVTLPPGCDIELEIAALEWVTPGSKWYLFLLLLMVAVGLGGGRSLALNALRRREAEATLAATEERYASVFDAVGEGILILDADDGHLLDANGAAATLFGLQEPDDLRASAAVARWMDRAAECDSPFEWDDTDDDGRSISLETTVHQVVMGDMPRLVTIVRDIRDRRQAEGERRHLEEQLQHAQRMESLGRMAGGVAHDFNNILTGIICSCDLARPAARDEVVRASLDEIRDFSGKAADLTRQLLAFSRRQPMSPKPISLGDIVAGSLPLVERLGPALTVHFERRATADTVLGDASQIEQVLVNLAVNARDAMPEGGRLTIVLDNVEVAEREAPDLTAGPYVRLRVRDGGSGIDPAIRDRLFEPFVTTKEGGTGLGLSMVYGAVRQHEGAINVVSGPLGTEFVIRLPVIDPVSPEEGRAAPPAAKGGSERILVLEDNDRLRKLLIAILRREGYAVTAVATPDEARQAVDGGAPDLLLSDVVLPGMSGPRLYQTLRARRPDLPVLFISGYPNLDDIPGGRMDPSWPLLPKPFPPDLLCRRVREILDDGAS